jgi:hypothetical protein
MAAHPGKKGSGPAGEEASRGTDSGPAGTEEGRTGLPGQLEKSRPSREVAALAQPAYGFYPGPVQRNPSWESIIRPKELYSGPSLVNPAWEGIFRPRLLFTCLFNILHI